MPNFTFSQLFTANQRGFDPLTSWQYRYNPYPRAACQLYCRSTTAGNVLSLYSGSTTIRQRSPVQAGGTAGVTPTAFTTEPDEWIAGANDLILIQLDEILGGTPTVDGIIKINPF